jgi:RsiW-degrading membrane proteinase PrsW (M82 family)
VLKVPSAPPPAESSTAGKNAKASPTADDIPDDWLSAGPVSSTAGMSSEPDEFASPARSAELPPRVAGKSGRSAAAGGMFVPTREAGDQPVDVESRPRKATKRAAGSDAGWRDHLLWVLLLALIPLAVSTLVSDQPFEERLAETIRQHPDAAGRLEGSKDDFLAALPEKKIAGAHLPHGTWFHWGYAALSAILFLGVLTQAFPGRAAGPSRLFWTGVATGTVGILLLLAFQWVAMFTQGFNIRGRGIVVILFYIVKFIGFSYRAALDPDNGFFLSFLGFICGVGLCEELCKALPVVMFLRGQPHAGWKAACLVGLASGVGFGVSEGITYSADSYNGIATGMIYLVRFASCVALHSMWAGAVALVMCRNQDYVGGDGFDWGDAGNFVLHYLAIAMVLHGLYDTLLKKEHEFWALAIAAISFGWLVWLVRRARSEE